MSGQVKYWLTLPGLDNPLERHYPKWAGIFVCGSAVVRYLVAHPHWRRGKLRAEPAAQSHADLLAELHRCRCRAWNRRHCHAGADSGAFIFSGAVQPYWRQRLGGFLTRNRCGFRNYTFHDHPTEGVGMPGYPRGRETPRVLRALDRHRLLIGTRGYDARRSESLPSPPSSRPSRSLHELGRGSSFRSTSSAVETPLEMAVPCTSTN